MKEVNLRKLICFGTAAAALALPATASAETIDQTGQILDDDATKVTLQVDYNGVNALNVANFKAKRVFTRCAGEPTRINFTALDAVPVDLDGTFKSRLSDKNGGFLRIAGKVKDNGQATVGTLKTNQFESAGGDVCKTPKQKFKTSS